MIIVIIMHQILSKALLLKVHCLLSAPNLCLFYPIMNSNCCYHIVLKNASLYFTCETIYLFSNTIIIKPDMKNKYELKQRFTYTLSCSMMYSKLLIIELPPFQIQCMQMALGKFL